MVIEDDGHAAEGKQFPAHTSYSSSVKPSPREDEDPREEEEERPPPVAYRVSGDVQVRAAELEQQVAELKRSLKTAEHEMYKARRIVRARTLLERASTGGLGALVGSIVGAVVYGLYDQPFAIPIATVACFGIGYVARSRRDPPDDNFPPAPPARMY